MFLVTVSQKWFCDLFSTRVIELLAPAPVPLTVAVLPPAAPGVPEATCVVTATVPVVSRVMLT